MKSRIVSAVVLALVLARAGSAGASSGVMPQEVRDATWKLMRGVTNTAIGLPGEIVSHSLGGLAAPQAKSVGAGVTGFFSGIVIGTVVGVERIGSGIVDVATFPVPFDDNRPLIEPEFPF